MSNINSNFLRETFKPLVSVDDRINDSLEHFHYEVVAGIKKIKAAINEANNVSKDFLPEVRAKSQREILRKAYEDIQATVDKGAQPILATPHMLHADLAAAARPKTPDNDIQELIQLLKAQEIRTSLRGMTQDERSSLLRSSTALGDGSILNAMETSLVPLLPASSIDAARDVFLRTSHKELVTKAEQAETLSNAVRHTLDTLPKAVESIMREAGLEKPFADRNADKKAAALSMTDKEKSDFISAHGPEAFQKLMSGE